VQLLSRAMKRSNALAVTRVDGSMVELLHVCEFFSAIPKIKTSYFDR
jgi:hypothetical protein